MNGMMIVGVSYHNPKSGGQQAYTVERLAQLAEEAKQRKIAAREAAAQAEGISLGEPEDESAKGRHDRAESGGMNYASHSETGHKDLLSNPFELRHGRRYLRELPYPLPVDLAEMQRQNLRTLLGCRVFGRAVCSPKVASDIPRKVLEVACGSGYWSAMCNDFFCNLGYKDVAFTGLDIAPLAPDLNKQGVNWTFAQHDMRRYPLPFDDEEFDLIMMKDTSLTVPRGPLVQKFLDECIRILSPGGTLEIWESDHVLRSLLPHPPPAPSKQAYEQDMADRTATFLIAPGTPFAQVQNRYLSEANAWVAEALDRRKLPPTPCAKVSQILFQEPESLFDVGNRRIAVPLGELRWEVKGSRHSASVNKAADGSLTPDQQAIRQTALLTVVQQIESLEPLLREVSGKNVEEWAHWWTLMMNELLDPARGAVTGECLEMGAWWATKRVEE